MNAKKCKAMRRAARKHCNPATKGYDLSTVQRVVGHTIVATGPDGTAARQVVVATTRVAKHKAGSAPQVYKFLKAQARAGKI